MRNNKFLIPIVKRLRKEFMLGMLILCLGCSILAVSMGWDSLFPAIGSIWLSVLLTHRCMLTSKRAEAELETYRYEMVYSVPGTLTMGSGRNVGRMDTLIC